MDADGDFSGCGQRLVYAVGRHPTALSVFLIILAAGFFAGGYTYGRPQNSVPPEYPMENHEKEQES